MWTASIVAERLSAAFAPHHRDIGGPRPVRALIPSDYLIGSGNRRVEAKDPTIFVDDAKARPQMPRLSDYVQLCCRASRLSDGERIADRKQWRDAHKAGTALLGESDELVDEVPSEPVTSERDLARAVRGDRIACKDNPAHFAELLAEDTEFVPREFFVVNDDRLALEAQDWIVRDYIMEDLDLEASRILVVCLLKSGKEAGAFCRKHDLPLMAFLDRCLDVFSAIADRLNDEGVPVRGVVRRMRFGKQILQGVPEIAGYLGRSIEGTQTLIDDGKLPVAEYGGVTIANDSFIRFKRKHRARTEHFSQASVT